MRILGRYMVLAILVLCESCIPPDPRLGDDLFTALTWATLDACQSPMINKTIEQPQPEKILRRRKRTIFLAATPALTGEFRYVFPVIAVNKELNTHISLQFPLNFNMAVPFVEVTTAARALKADTSMMLNRLEDIISMAGVNGRSCIMRSICEVGSLGPVSPKGVIGELITITLKYVGKENVLNATADNTHYTYLDAAARGRVGVDCSKEFDCPISLLNIVKETQNFI